jgi:hypothetical protein
MNLLLRHSRAAVLVAVLMLSGLALATSPAPAAHAGSPPSITAVGGDLDVGVNGSGFTASSTSLVKVWLYHPKTKKWTLENKTSVVATSTGKISAAIWSGAGKVHVRAYDKMAHTWSNLATTIVKQLQ